MNIGFLKSSIIHSFLCLLITVIGVSSCIPSKENETITYQTVPEEGFSDIDNVSVKLDSGFILDLWAPGSLLASPVSITFDSKGFAYISETTRRKSSDIDIRSHWDWAEEDLSLESLEETEAFHKKKLAIELGKENTWQEDFNQDGSHDWRDLMVQSERIRRVWDGDGNGRADSSNIMAESFNSMLTGVAAGITHHQNQVYLAVAPDLWRVTDKDGNGKADNIESISHGYGIHIGYAGHDMSGLTIGPDGKIYWSIGDLGVNTVDQTGKRWKYPHQGAVMRANPDGSDFEVFAYGLRNPQELAFDEYGNLISVDNDGDHAGEHERFVHIIEGSDTGWRTYWQFGKYNEPGGEYKVWMDEKLHVPYFKGQAAYILPPIALASDGPAGLAYNPGTALGERWKGYFFSSFFKGSSARSKINAFKLAPSGASFTLEDDREILVGLNMTGITIGPDGALYMADWLDGYDKKPEGRIWKLDVQDDSYAEKRKEVQQILAKGMKDQSVESLYEFLGHEDMRVRMEAQFELVQQNEKESLLDAAKNPGGILKRLHGLWGIGQLAREDRSLGEVLLSFLNDHNGEIRAQSAKLLGDIRYEPALKKLISQTTDTSARAVFFAVEALGKIGKTQGFEAIVNVLDSVKDSDIHLRYATFIALGRIGDALALANLAEHPSSDVRLGAVVALRRIQSPEVAIFLQDKDPLVVIEAARAIHDDESIPEALPILAQSLDDVKVNDEAFVRRAINANLRLGGAESAQRLADYAASQTASPKFRSIALESLGFWPSPSPLDWVEGSHRDLNPHDANEAIAAISDKLDLLFTQSPSEVTIATSNMCGKLNFKDAEKYMYRLVKHPKEDFEVRSAALAAMAEMDSEHTLEALEWIMEGNERKLRQEAMSYLVRMNVDEDNMADLLSGLLQKGSTTEKQNAIKNIGSLTNEKAHNILKELLEEFINRTLDPNIQLDVYLAIENSQFDDLKNELLGYESNIKEEDPLAIYQTALEGGDAKEGRTIFYRHQAAQCVKCHQIDGRGGQVGPDLTGIANTLDRSQILQSLIAPSERIAPGYGIVSVNLKNGQTVSGNMMGETDQEISLKNAEGEIITLPISDIKERKEAPSSMPAMNLILNKKEIRDLVAYLSGLKENEGELSMKN